LRFDVERVGRIPHFDLGDMVERVVGTAWLQQAAGMDSENILGCQDRVVIGSACRARRRRR
jgi:hypothetical protein